MSAKEPDIPDEAKELALVNKVELRIALADSDSKLEGLLKIYLAPLLLKLASPHVTVRNKVISICQHINTRIKSHSMKLPVEALVKQFKDQDIGGKYPLVRHFDLMYIQQGVSRLSTKEQIDLLPLFTSSISKNSENHLSALFHIILEILIHYKPPGRGTTEDAALRAHFFSSNKEDIVFLQKWFAKLMLLNFNTFGEENKTCRGLSPAEHIFLTVHKKETWQPADQPVGLKLKNAKYSVLKFLSSGAFTDRERFLPSFIASAHSVNEDSGVTALAEEIFKRSVSSIDLNDELNTDLIDNLYYYLFFGEETNLPPIRWTFRGKILSLLSKSSVAVSQRFADGIPKIASMGLVPYDPANENRDTSLLADAERDRKKFRSEVFIFLNKVATGASQETLETYGPALVERLQYYIVEEGQLMASGKRVGMLAAEDTRSLAYDAVGMLCRRLPKTMVYEPELGILRFLFDALRASGVTPAIRSSVESALGSILMGSSSERYEFKEEVTNALAEFLITLVEQEEGHLEANEAVRYQATRFANRGLPFHNVQARWICLITASDVGLQGNPGRLEAAEEGKRGLDPYWFKVMNPPSPVNSGNGVGNTELDQSHSLGHKKDKYAYPTFTELVHYITSPHPQLTTSKKSFNGIPLEIYPTAVDFCRRLLIIEALNKNTAGGDGKSNGDSHIDVDFFSTKLDSSIATDDLLRAAMVQLLHSYFSGPNRAAIEAFASLTFTGMILGDARCMEEWVEMCALAPSDLLSSWASNSTHVRSLTKIVMDAAGTTFDLEKQNLMIKALVSLVCHPACEREILTGLLSEFLNGQETNEYRNYASIVGAASILGRLKLYGRLETCIDTEMVKKTVGKVTNALSEPPSHRVSVSLEAALQAIMELSVFGLLYSGDLPSATAESLIDRLAQLSLKQEKERAVLALGCFSLTFPEADEQSYNKKIEEALFKIHGSKRTELLFAAGEALSIYSSGWWSKSLLRRFLDTQGCQAPADVVAKRRDSLLLQGLLDKLLKEWGKSTKPSLRKAVCVWLLSLMESSGHLEQVGSRLREIQGAFRSFLVDRDEFIQETAARGLTMVYEKGDKHMKEELVKDLIASFTGDSKRTGLAGNVSADTQLFEPGALPTGDGSVTTYKDIMSLASEVGDPSLVYRFMSLARHNSLWAERASFGRFGLGSILSSSSVVSGYLEENPKVYSKLYRYKFDPNSNVRKSMNDIWNALVRDNKLILDKYFENIMDELLKSIFEREWRVREASCAAISDLVQGRDVASYGKYLQVIWSAAFKVMDDIKESVRLAAFSLCRTLVASMIRVVSVDEGASQKNADMILKNLMPFLMGPNGLEAEAKEVQAFALETLTKLVKAAGKVLKDYIPDLVETMLGLLSSLEPSVINYLHLNASKYNLTEEKIDSARLHSVRSSPMMETIERCLDLTDEQTMAKLAPRIEKVVKKAIGLPSKVGCSRIIVTLTLRQTFLTRPYANGLLKAVQSAILDRNDTVSASYAVAAGYLCRISSDENVMALIAYTKDLYFHHEDDRDRSLGGEVMHSISKHAPDRFNALAAEILPFCFVAMNDANQAVREGFEETWDENTGGIGAIKLYMKEIVSLTCTHLGSQKWAVKQGSANALAHAAKSLGKDITLDLLQILWPAIVDAVGGKSWHGKEQVLDAFADLAVNAVKLIQQDQQRVDEVRKILLREAKRKNAAYKSHAIKSLGKFVDAYPEVDLYEQVEEIVSAALEDEGDSEDAMEVDAKDGESGKTIKRTTYNNSIITLAQAFRLPPDTKAANVSFLKVLGLIKRDLQTSASTVFYESKKAQVSASTILLERVISGNSGKTGLSYAYIEIDRLEKIWDILYESGRDKGNESLRQKAADGIMKIVTLLSEGSKAGGNEAVQYKRLWDEKVKAGVANLMGEERSWDVKKLLGEVDEAGKRI